MSVTNKKAMLLGDGWNWIEYDDGSGHLENPNGKSVISFDYTTQEYRDVHGEWKYMNNYPDTIPWDQFKTDMENLIVAEELASYNDLVDSIAVFEEELEIQSDYRLFQNGRFVGWNAYQNIDEVNHALYDLLLAGDEPDVFDLGIADRLCENYSPNAVCSMLTDNQKELVVIGVECERDWNNIVSPNLKLLYDEIIDEQSETEALTMQI